MCCRSSQAGLISPSRIHAVPPVSVTSTQIGVTPVAKLGGGQHDDLVIRLLLLLYTLKYVSHSKEAVSSMFVSGR